jgi:hypothetical protein
MKQSTRDNIIYLAVGLSIAALLAGDAFYAFSHDRKMWMPSRFALRVVTTAILLIYFVIRQTRQMRLALTAVFTSVLLATLLHLTIFFGLREIVEQLPGITFSALGALELFFVSQLSAQVVPYFTGSRH